MSSSVFGIGDSSPTAEIVLDIFQSAASFLNYTFRRHKMGVFLEIVMAVAKIIKDSMDE